MSDRNPSKSATIKFESGDLTDEIGEDADNTDRARTPSVVRNRHASIGSTATRDSWQSFVAIKSFAARKSLFESETSALIGNDGPDFAELERRLEAEKGPCAGFFMDYMERSRALERKRAARMTMTMSPSSTMKKKQARHSKSITASPNVVDYQAELAYEHMVDELMDSLNTFWREEGNTNWAPKNLDILKTSVRDIIKGKRKMKCVSFAVKSYETRYKPTHERSKGLEHQDARHSRLKDFLKQYHASASKVDLQMPNSDGRLRLVQSDPAAAHMAFTKSLEQKQKPSSSSVAHRPQSAGSSHRPQKLDNWKIRAARGHGTRSMELSRQIGRELSQMPEPPASPFESTLSSLEASYLSGSTLYLASPTSSSWKSPKSSPSAGGSSTLTGTWGLKNRASPKPPPLDRQSLRVDTTLRGTLGHAKEGPHSSSLGALNRVSGQRPLSGKRPLPLSQSAPSLLSGNGNASSSPMSAVRQQERNPFVSPWRGSNSEVGIGMDGAITLASESPVGKYLREAELNYVSPKFIPFITGHSDGLQAKNQALDDCDLLVIGTMLPGKKVITEVDLCGNTLLTEKSLVPFLDKIFDQPVEKLSLNHCLHYALPPGIKKTLDVVQRLLADVSGLKFLKVLDLSGIAMPVGTHVPLCHAIQEHPRLTNVSLADTGMSGGIAKQCIRQLTASNSVQVLDLSWNNFNPDVFILLGERLSTTYTLLSLHIANCSSSQSDLDNPIAYFMEYLSHNPRLTRLDISVNRITFRGALVLEDALESHSKLADITVSNNPIGVLGMRCLLRLLARPTSGFIRMNAEGVAGGTIKEAETEKMQLFRHASPGGSYKLNLSRPYHRALLRMVYKSCDRLCLSPDNAFKDVHYSKGAYNHPTKDSDGLYSVLVQGTLEFKFMPVASLATSGPLKGIADDAFGTFLDRYADSARLHVGLKKMVPMMAYWRSIEGRVADQLLVLEAMGKDFAFTCDQIEMMCRSRPIVSDVLWRLMPCVVGGLAGVFFASRLAINLSEYASVHNQCKALIEFNCDNPTGHYKLNLENPNEFNVAERIILLDRWETQINRRLDRADVSQKGNGSHLRNVKFEDAPIRDVQSVVDWSMREWDKFEFDYASSKRPPSGVPNVSDEHWESMLVAAQTAGCSHLLQVDAFRRVSHHFYLSAHMLRQLINLFQNKEQRLDIFVNLFFRVTDIWNEKVARVCFEAEHDADTLRQRLGYLTYFPWIQPEQSLFKLNLTHHDERIALHALVNLDLKERVGSIRTPVFMRGDGVRDLLPLGIPPRWAFLDKIEEEGIFSCQYTCAPEDRSILERKKNIEQFGYWPGPNSVDDVNWWSDITNIPEDVIEFLEFLVTRYNNVYEAFEEIDRGPGGEPGNKSITHKEFDEGLWRMDFRKFSGGRSKKKSKKKGEAGGHDYSEAELKRIAKVYRHLDPSGDGQVSQEEWGVLDQLFKETHLSIHEFVVFLDRTFDDLRDAWDFLTRPGPGTQESDPADKGLDREAWEVASQSVGYYGPTRPIFSYLDKDGEGTVSYEEFEVLADFGNLKKDDVSKEGD